MTSVVMPVEPTPEMIEAGVKVEGWGCTPELDREAAANTYRAMLAARPDPASVPGDGDATPRDEHGRDAYDIIRDCNHQSAMSRAGIKDRSREPLLGPPHDMAVSRVLLEQRPDLDASEADRLAVLINDALAARPKPPADLVRAVILATDDGDHHPPISQWAAERAVEVVMEEMAVRPAVGEAEPVSRRYRFDAEIAWLREAAFYFSRRPTGGEDRAHWENVYNAENANKLADRLTALRRPAPTVEEVARVIDPAAFMFAPDELSKDADPRAPALEKAARIHALLTGERG